MTKYEKKAIIAVTIIFLVGMISMALFFTTHQQTDMAGRGVYAHTTVSRLVLDNCYCQPDGNYFYGGYFEPTPGLNYLGKTTQEYCRKTCLFYKQKNFF